MADSKDYGVVDHRNEVFDNEGLFCIDSSAIPTSLGVNPSLTISAVSERAVAQLIDRAADYGLPAKPAGFTPGVPGRRPRPAHDAACGAATTPRSTRRSAATAKPQLPSVGRMRKLAIALAALCSARDRMRRLRIRRDGLRAARRGAGRRRAARRGRGGDRAAPTQLGVARPVDLRVPRRGDQRAPERRQRAGGAAPLLQPGDRGRPVQRQRPGQRPQAVQGLGDEDALGPAGAYWIDDFRQLFVLRGERQFVYQLSAPGLGADAARRAAVRLARATLPERRGEAASQTAEGGTAALDLDVLAPRTGESVRSDRVVVRGIVSGEDVAVAGRGPPGALSATGSSRARCRCGRAATRFA